MQPDKEETRPSGRRKKIAPWLLGGLVLLLLFTLIAQQAFGVWAMVTPDTAADTLLLYALSSLNFAAFIVFAFIFVRNLLKLRGERRERQLGSKIKTRLVVYFIAVSLLPITAMAAFSYFFLNRSLEKWFSSLPLDVVREAREAIEQDEETQQTDLKQKAETLATLFAAQPELIEREDFVRQLMRSGGVSALEITRANGDRKSLVETDHAAHLEHSESVTVPFGNESGATLSLARPKQVNENLGELMSAGQTFEHLKNRQRKVRLLGLSTLGLLTLMLLFAATWAAIHLARGIATPIKALAMASDEVARGNLEHRISSVADDELAVLAASFNQMTAQLEENRRRIDLSAAELREKNLALEERRAYIETILETISTGVISLDAQDHVTTINAAALAMLRFASAPARKTPLTEITSAEDFAVLRRLMRRARRLGYASDQVELGRTLTTSASTSANSSQTGETQLPVPVALTATALQRVAEANGQGCGVVLVLEDLSELLAAQRAAAWSEVARRMAHEIKNPLTPIQLSAERILRNFQRTFGDYHAAGATSDEIKRVEQVVGECTATIKREVASLKSMVDEFSRFARLPEIRPELADLNRIIEQAVALYEDRLGDVRLEMRLAPTLPEGLLDPEQLRRVFVNLIDNSLEALAESSEDGTEGERRITIASAYDPSRAQLLAEVADTGHGIAAPDLSRLFQPYFSTRGRGTGLGLAIVHRIITDHSGRIRAGVNHPRGAKFVIELPIAEETREISNTLEPDLKPLARHAPLAIHQTDHA